MKYQLDRIAICLEHAPGTGGIAAWRAAAETMRAGLFLARYTYFTPQLMPLAASLARATQRPAVSEDLESDEPKPHRGDLLPIAPELGAESEEAGFRALARHWSPEAFDQHAEGFGAENRPDICVALTPPISDFTRNLMSRSRRVVGFRNLRSEDDFSPDEKMEYLDIDWSPRRAADPESGRFVDERRALPPFGLMLQRFGLRSLG
jgi:hypothetical protein